MNDCYAGAGGCVKDKLQHLRLNALQQQTLELYCALCSLIAPSKHQSHWSTKAHPEPEPEGFFGTATLPVSQGRTSAAQSTQNRIGDKFTVCRDERLRFVHARARASASASESLISKSFDINDCQHAP
jgi:hypothetical protein